MEVASNNFLILKNVKYKLQLYSLRRLERYIMLTWWFWCYYKIFLLIKLFFFEREKWGLGPLSSRSKLGVPHPDGTGSLNCPRHQHRTWKFLKKALQSLGLWGWDLGRKTSSQGLRSISSGGPSLTSITSAHFFVTESLMIFLCNTFLSCNYIFFAVIIK